MDKTNLTCAILCKDSRLADRLTEYIGKMPCLELTAAHRNPLDALNEYINHKADLYFVQLVSVAGTDGIGGMEFCRLLSPETRVVFIAPDGQYAARCFQLDALDYLTDLDAPSFFRSVNKAVRWFARCNHVLPLSAASAVSSPDTSRTCIIHVRSENRIVRLRLDNILYVEGMGDYVKIHTQKDMKPVLTLSSMKLMETRLPESLFLRIHNSFIINKEHVESIGHSEVTLAGKRLPVGDAYRNRLNGWVAGLTVI